MEKCLGGTLMEGDPTKAEDFKGQEVRGEKGDTERNKDGEEEEDAERNEDGEEEKDVERSDDREELREKARTEGDAGPEAETDREQRREEPTLRRPHHVPGGKWLHKVQAYLSKIAPI
ncbi:hypothetical protein NDU88_003806 [Pleurodeles waltl]|uniref:Uncharacterized protein n=1 Tax=Pleurodeles waltl TaxID=8319 RepID=A0AAV7KVZ4_PLEWA|nr:hypothetical protein NDU88_003806 [Pleurodeles waltl]